MKNQRIHFYNQGVTILELLITLVIMVVLVAISAPSYRSYAANNHAQIVIDNLNTSLRLAKSEALQRGSPVKVCGSDLAPRTCNDTADYWTYGWQVIDVASGAVLHNYAPSGTQTLNMNQSSSVVYSSSGLPTPAAFTFTVMPPYCTTGYMVNYDSLSPGGSLQTAAVPCSSLGP